MFNNDISERYSRQTMLPECGEEGQRKLLESSVLLIGAGGLGSAAATYITGAGVGRIGIADPDVVSLSNLQRQTLYSESQIGHPKTECALKRLQGLSSIPTFTLYDKGLTAENAREIVRDYDIVLDCTDNFPTRYLIDDACADEGKPWIHGAIEEFYGHLTVFNYRKGIRYSHLYPDRETLCKLPRRVMGVMGAVPGVIGALQASEAIKIIIGRDTDVLEGRLFTIDMMTMKCSLINV